MTNGITRISNNLQLSCESHGSGAHNLREWLCQPQLDWIKARRDAEAIASWAGGTTFSTFANLVQAGKFEKPWSKFGVVYALITERFGEYTVVSVTVKNGYDARVDLFETTIGASEGRLDLMREVNDWIRAKNGVPDLTTGKYVSRPCPSMGHSYATAQRGIAWLKELQGKGFTENWCTFTAAMCLAFYDACLGCTIDTFMDAGTDNGLTGLPF